MAARLPQARAGHAIYHVPQGLAADRQVQGQHPVPARGYRRPPARLLDLGYPALLGLPLLVCPRGRNLAVPIVEE